MKQTYGYDSYHGRSRARTVLTALVAILLVVLAAVVAFFLLAQRYIVYTDDGQAHLELPFFQKTTPTPGPAPVESQNIVIITPDPTPTPTPTLKPAVKAVWLLRGAITDGSAEAQVKAEGGSAVVFNMKADDGTLGYVSSLPQAIALNSSAAEAGLNDAIKALTSGPLYTIARVSCFKDNKAPRNDNSLAIKTNSGYNWQDPEGRRWMNVSFPAAREYVIGVCKELAELGFDEILLTNCGYPPNGTGQMGWLRVDATYPWGSLDTIEGPFLAQVKAAIEPHGAVLSVEALGRELAGEERATGLTVDNVAENCAHVWMAESDALAYESVVAADGRLGKLLVPMSAQAGDEDKPWAVVTGG